MTAMTSAAMPRKSTSHGATLMCPTSDPAVRTPAPACGSEQMAHLRFLGAQIGVIELLGPTEHRSALGHDDALPPETLDLGGVVRQQRNRCDVEQADHFSGQFVCAGVDRDSEGATGFHRIEPGVLQRVGIDLGHEPRPAAL